MEFVLKNFPFTFQRKILWYCDSLVFFLLYPSQFLLYLSNTITFLGVFVKLRKAIISFVISVRASIPSHGTTRLALDGF